MTAAATDIKINAPVVGLGLALMVVGFGLFFFAVRRRDFEFARTSNPIVWTLIAMGPALLLFSIFPDSTAEGELGAFAVGGAFAAFAAAWWFGTGEGRRGIEADRDIAALRDEIAQLQGELAVRVNGDIEDPVLQEQQEFAYKVQGAKGRTIVIVTGDLLKVRNVDVWVSSENTNMQPARYHDRSISAMVRYHGAAKDEVGDPIDDLIGEELLVHMRNLAKNVVPPAAVIPTSPGRLEVSNNVKRLYHVAAVQGEPGKGYRPVADLGRCVTRALEKADDAAEASYDARSMLLPMLATGVARGAGAQIAPELFGAAAAYLSSHPATRMQRVYLLAWRRSELQHWRDAAERCGLVKPAKRGATEPVG
jgi:O-acetyl-ADP-ribose deacetylase (regulator of RNase III)